MSPACSSDKAHFDREHMFRCLVAQFLKQQNVNQRDRACNCSEFRVRNVNLRLGCAQIKVDGVVEQRS